MKKVVVQGVLLVITFSLIWLGFSQIDFIKVFNVKKAGENTEQKLGKLFWEAIEKQETIIRNDSINQSIKKIIRQIADSNGIDSKVIKLHIVNKNEVNAFAMPDNHLIVYSGLITDCNSDAQLAGVLGHEIAHLQKKHVMKKLVKEIGLSVLISMATGNNSKGTISSAVHQLSSLAYDRQLETEADLASADYLIKAGVNPAPFADFLYSMSKSDESLPAALSWLSTHPESEERAKAIIEYIKGKTAPKGTVLTLDQWKWLQEKVVE